MISVRVRFLRSLVSFIGDFKWLQNTVFPVARIDICFVLALSVCVCELATLKHNGNFSFQTEGDIGLGSLLHSGV